MTKINIDTNKMKECGTDMINLSLELKEQINGLFNTLSSVNRYWSGLSAEQFLNYINIEKEQYYNFVESLHKEGTFIFESALSLEKKINEIKW